MHTGFLSWQRERRRRLQGCFASLGGLGRLPPAGGGPPKQPVPGKKEEKIVEGAKDKDGQQQGKTSLKSFLKETKENVKAAIQEEKPPAARIVAYSDSEGEDEPFRLTRRRKKKAEEAAGDGAGAAAAETADDEPSTSAPAGGLMEELSVGPQAARGQPRVFRAVRAVGRRGVGRLSSELGWGALLQLLLLWLGRRWRRRPTRHCELLSLAISLPDALGCLLGVRCPSQRVPQQLQALLQFVESWARPAALLQLGDLARQVPRRRRRRRMLTTISQSVRVFQEMEAESPSPSAQPIPRAAPRLAAEAASLHRVELTEMKRVLAAQGVRLPAERFDDTNAELMRFAVSAGLLQAESPEEKAHAIQEGAQRVAKTLDWLRRQRFLPAAQLKEWHHIVRWQGTDAEGLPILVIKAAKACADCQAEDAELIAQAVMSQMQRALAEVFSNRHGPDKLVVVVDAGGADSLQAARNAALLKQVAVSLNKHYPHRLQQLYVVDLPAQLRWVLATIKPLLHPATKGKIRTVSPADPGLPFPAQALRGEAAADGAAASAEGERSGSEAGRPRRVSIPELPVSTSSPAGGGPRRSSIPALPSAEQRPRRRVRIADLPFREPPQHTSSFGSASGILPGEEEHTTGSVLRPALKRSASAGLIGMRINLNRDELEELR